MKAQLNARYCKEFFGATHEARAAFFSADQEAENLMLAGTAFVEAIASCKTFPWVDMCCDLLGTNSLCPYYLSSEQDSAHFDSRDFVAFINPPYKDYAEIVLHVEVQADAGPMEAVLILPINKSLASPRA